MHYSVSKNRYKYEMTMAPVCYCFDSNHTELRTVTLMHSRFESMAPPVDKYLSDDPLLLTSAAAIPDSRQFVIQYWSTLDNVRAAYI